MKRLKTEMGAVIAVLCLGSFCMCGEPGKLPHDLLESPEWMVNGHPAPSSATMQQLTDSIIAPISHEGYWYSLNESLGEGVWQVDTVGKLAGRTVVDLVYTVDFRDWQDSSKVWPTKAIKAIAIGTVPDRYRLVYACGTEAGNIFFEKSFVVKVDGTEVLCTDSRMTGSGAFHEEQYWVWDSGANAPRPLDIGRARGDALSRVMPKGNHIRSGGTIDIHSLYYEHPTRRDAEDTCCPFPFLGWVRIKYGISEEEIVVRWAEFWCGEYSDIPPWQQIVDTTVSPKLRPMITYTPEHSSPSTPGSGWKYLNRFGGLNLFGEVAGPVDSIVALLDRREAGRSTSANPTRWVIDSIGPLRGHQVVEMAYSFTCAQCRDTAGKAILIECEPDEYKLLYQELTLPGEPTIGKNYLVPLGTDTVIAVEGTVYEKPHKPLYWVWPKESEAPVFLYQDWVLNETLTLLAPKWLPRGLVARSGKGKWDFFKLTYETPIWREGEADSDPSGGTLFIQFGLHDTRLIPVSYSYTVPDSTGTR